MNRRLIGMALAAGLGIGGANAALTINDLRAEYRVEPLGISERSPRLSWTVASGERGAAQTAYHILVASSRENLERGTGDLWDTGRVASSDTAQIAYGGKPLASRVEAWWKVRVWDEHGRASDWSAPTRWTMGLLEPSDWKAEWISAPAPPAEPAASSGLSGLAWVWVPDEPATSEVSRGTRFFRRVVRLPDTVSEASFAITADDHFRLFLNGEKAAESDDAVDAWRRPETLDVTRFLRPGENVLAVSVRNDGGPAGLVGVLRVRDTAGEWTILPIDGSWKAASNAAEGWLTAGFDDSGWQGAAEVAKVGDAPWHVPGQSMAMVLPPSPQLRKPFRVDGGVQRATLTITALGLYEARLNGERVGNDVFRPGWTDYKKRVYYQTYDVTDMVRRGENALGVTLADGWAVGYVGLGGRDRYGVGRPRLLAQLEVVTDDGSAQLIATDGSWKAHYGPIKEADMLMGETYDARDESAGWAAPGFDDSAWDAAEPAGPWPAALEGYPGVPVRAMRELKPVSVTPAPAQPADPGTRSFIYDMGQNMVGWARIKVRGAAGTKVRLRFAEMLNPDGSMYVTNLRSARNVDTYILKGGGEEVWEPRFTFHGFRYVEVSGLPEAPALEDVTGVVVHSDIPDAGTFTTSNPLVNQLQHNIRWGMWGNFLEVPTDCPQRDERLGWMGDAQVFVKTATYNADVAAFFTKWMIDVEDAQRADGAFWDVAPAVAVGAGAAAWADAGVIVPWTIYEAYGDTRILERHYDAMAKFIGYMERDSDGLLRPAEGYGDWLSIGADTPKDVLATAYFAYSTSLMARIAGVLGKDDDAARFADLERRIKGAFNAAYVSPDGRIKGDTQSCYVMALKMDLLPAPLRPRAAQYLVEDIRKRGNHLSTGFIGTAYLNPVLSAAGHTDTAYELLLQDTFPGWLFSIEHGATTIWERWDGWTPDKGFQDPGMNSFNHYSFGAVDEWLYGTVGGIRNDPRHPGFSHFAIAPEPGGGLTHARATYSSIRGEVVSDWRHEGGVFSLEVTVPANTTATVTVPAARAADVSESGRPANKADGVTFLSAQDGRASYRVESGSYHFRVSDETTPSGQSE